MSSEQQLWSTDEVIEQLRKVHLFEGVPDEDLEEIAKLVDSRHVDGGEIVFPEGEPGDAFYIVFRGAVEIVKSRPAGGEDKLAVREKGDGFGEMSLLNDAPRSATARAMEASELMVIRQSAFQELIGGESLALRMLRGISQDLREMSERYASRKTDAEAGGEDRGADLGTVNRSIRQSLLPLGAPRIAGFDVAGGTMQEADGTGRTIWDTFPLADGRWALMALDVQGEGLPPAHALALARVLIREFARDGLALGDVLARANQALAETALNGVDQAIACGLIAPSEAGIEWVSAGRTPGALIGREGAFTEFPAGGPPLGVMDGFRYRSRSLEMGTGDCAMVLSRASTGLFRGAADLVATLQGKPAGEVVSTLHRAIRMAEGEGEDVGETTVIFLRKQ